MKRFFTKFRTLSSSQHWFLARMTGSMAVLMLAATLVSTGSPAAFNRMIVQSAQQTACIISAFGWGCGGNDLSFEALYPENSSGQQTTTFQPGQYIHFQWNAGIYGNNYFSSVCAGSKVGSGDMCTVALGSPNENWGTCSPETQYCTGYTTTQTCTAYGAYGDCYSWAPTQTCSGYAYTTPSGCGNADDWWGNYCFGPNGGTSPSCPGFDGNWGDIGNANSANFAAPSTPGTYTYYFCSNFLLNRSYNGSSQLPCIPATITVAAPPPTCSLTPLTQSISQTQNATLSYSDTNTSNATYSIDGTNQGSPSGNPFSIPGSSMSAGEHTITMDVIGSGGSGNCSAVVEVGGSLPGDICTDIPGVQTTLPPGCTGPAPSPIGACIPPGYSYNGSSCVQNCANGLSASYEPSCKCLYGQIQSGSICTAAPTSCSNGLNNSYAPNCTCPSGQAQSGSSCVAPGSINNLSASPNRVRKGDQTAVTWSTGGMKSCTLEGPVNGTATVLSTQLSGSVQPAVTSQSTYTLTCVDAIGTTRSQSVTVNLIPDIIEQ